MAYQSDDSDASVTKIIVSMQETRSKKSQPKRVLHFSDGVLEEYSTDDESDNKPASASRVMDTSTLTWMSYVWYLAWTAGSKTLAVCDYLGENLAYFFGITSPKYRYEIEEYGRIQQEEQEDKTKEDVANWSTDVENNAVPITSDLPRSKTSPLQRY